MISRKNLFDQLMGNDIITYLTKLISKTIINCI